MSRAPTLLTLALATLCACHGAPAGDSPFDTVACFPHTDPAAPDVAPPAASACDIAAPFVPWTPVAIGGEPTPADLGPQTLPVEIGVWCNATQRFVPYEDGQWVAIDHGNNAIGSMVYAGYRVPWSGPLDEKERKLFKSFGTLWNACVNVGGDLAAQSWARPDPHKDGWVTNAQALNAGLLVGLSSYELYIGEWVILTVDVRDPQSNTWGRAQRVLRLYDRPLGEPLP